jgi:hypothetical protein
MANTHQPGVSVFRSILPKDVDWKPFGHFHQRWGSLSSSVGPPSPVLT